MQRASAAHSVSRARVSLQLELAPAELAHLDGLLRRSTPTGRVRGWTLRHATQGEVTAEGPRPRAIFNDPEAIAEAARLGLGVALLPVPFVAASLARGALVRLLPGRHQEVGSVYLYHPSRTLLPAKTRVFVDFVLARFEADGFARRMRAD
ncbi:LysR substrate-binding domain-containing protein [Xenophilus aerolatus]|nr:LysR substrate-binding domain-containing protein [Xenophilus aerolatus]